jgi:hypothetical protein
LFLVMRCRKVRSRFPVYSSYSVACRPAATDRPRALLQSAHCRIHSFRQVGVRLRQGQPPFAASVPDSAAAGRGRINRCRKRG